ncbi:RsmB/NOP family class I SAM-dependent RNA methyltransferase [Pelagibacterium limicola]|uniref:RsmB/NOP family class I SAM-dependent RNA methyltransferase n=1 Tax=Pelagibacterium limicola TaxID=2791022 RepID=UPI0018B00CEB|nr:RsmB/NOP family class I SAM-dependent RNA methyltransferase [Pelagibacterium limicola]
MRDIDSIPGLRPRLEAAWALRDVLAGKSFVPLAADKFSDSRDRALANRLATLALRRHGHISIVIHGVLAKGIPPRSGLLEAVLRLGIAQLLYSNDIADHSALHLSVEAVRRDRRAGRFDKLVNGALRAVQREAERWRELDPVLLFPDRLKESWTTLYGEAAVSLFAQALLNGAPLDLSFKAPDAELAGQLGAIPVLGGSYRLETREAAVADLPGFAEGKWWVQDVAAALPARFVAAKAGESVLDLCAAPGGKTAQLAAAGAAVTALDISLERMKRVEENLLRLGLDAEIVVADALKYEPGKKFDAVLLDAPCSATGTLRRHPEVVFSRSKKDVAGRVALQRALIEKAAGLLKPGGRLVYAVCSLEAEEGEAQLDWVRDSVEGLIFDPVRAEEIESWTEALNAAGALRTHPALTVPGEAGGTLDGFFAARFVRRS